MNQKGPPSESGDWRRQPLTWALLREHMAPWFIRHRRPMSIALAVAIVVWGTCRLVIQVGNPQLPADVVSVHVTDYAQAYDVYREGPTVILRRVRGDGAFPVIWVAFCITWWMVYVIEEYASKRDLEPKVRRTARSSLLITQAIFAFIVSFLVYGGVSPSLNVLLHPQVIVLDPTHDLVTLNDEPIGHLSDITEFDGIEEHAYHKDWAWFGVKVRTGRYYPFLEGEFVGSNSQPIAAYLNQYFRQVLSKK